MPTRDPVAYALARAVANHIDGLITAEAAREIVSTALAQLEKSDHPHETYKQYARFVEAARSIAVRGSLVRDVLNSYEERGMQIAHRRHNALYRTVKLPKEAENHFLNYMRDYFDIPYKEAITIHNIRGNEKSGFEFHYRTSKKSGQAFIACYRGHWLVSPWRIEPSVIDVAVEEMQRFFDEQFSDEIAIIDESEAMYITALKEKILPDHVVFPEEESDPYNLSSHYPLVFFMDNPTESPHGFFVGLNPETGEADAYMFD